MSEDKPSVARFDPRVLPDSPVWTDRRLTQVTHNQFAYAANVPETAHDLSLHKQLVRQRILLAAGLRPMPSRPPVKARIWDWFPHEGVTVGKVRFASLPSLHVTGNLYMPAHVRGPLPAILCPHGHWPRGRVHHDDRGSVPLRCIELARLGFVVFSYDMIGYNDSRDLAHRWPDDLHREAALFGINPFGLQLWNSLRAVDFLSALPDVNPAKLGCTGASGGASQTWNLAAVDDRIGVIAPVCMLSCHFQGGCPCEEAPLLRTEGLTSVDVLMALAPRPLLLPSVSRDWTNLNPYYELQAVKTAYGLVCPEDRVKGVHLDDQHNYNRRTREHVYPWFVRWLQGVHSTPDTIPEPDLEPPPVSRLRHSNVVDMPSERRTRTTLRRLQRHAAERFAKPPETPADLRLARQVLRPLYADILNVKPPQDVAVRVTFGDTVLPTCRVSGRVLSRRDVGDVVSALLVSPDHGNACEAATLIVMPSGKEELFVNGRPAACLQRLLSPDHDILAIDVLGIGDTACMLDRDCRAAADPLDWAFNPSLLSMRVQDVLTAIAMLRQHGYRQIRVVASGDAARYALLALPLAGPVNSADCDLTGVDLTSAGWHADGVFHPQILKLGGLAAPILLTAPLPLTLKGASRQLRDFSRQVYRVSGREHNLRWR